MAGCGSIVKVNNCPNWVKPIPKDDSPYDESITDEMIKFLYDHQSHYEKNCKK